MNREFAVHSFFFIVFISTPDCPKSRVKCNVFFFWQSPPKQCAWIIAWMRCASYKKVSERECKSWRIYTAKKMTYILNEINLQDFSLFVPKGTHTHDAVTWMRALAEHKSCTVSQTAANEMAKFFRFIHNNKHVITWTSNIIQSLNCAQQSIRTADFISFPFFPHSLSHSLSLPTVPFSTQCRKTIKIQICKSTLFHNKNNCIFAQPWDFVCFSATVRCWCHS